MEKQNQFSEEMANALKQIAELTSQIKEMNETAGRNAVVMERMTRIMLCFTALSIAMGVWNMIFVVYGSDPLFSKIWLWIGMMVICSIIVMIIRYSQREII